jgi:NADH-quinone oxidoreductase subunit J
MTLHLFLLAAMLLTSVLAATSKSFLYAAMWLSMLSISLTGVMFNMNAAWAGVFELSVCAGLITVLFASTASMVGKGKKYAENERKAMNYLPVSLFIFALLAFFVMKRYDFTLGASFVPACADCTVGDVIWQSRTLDLAGQICIFVAAVLMVKTFFGEKGNE